MQSKKVTAQTYSHEFIKLSENELFFVRSQAYEINSHETDCYGDFWSFIFADLPDQALKITNQGQSYTLSGKVGILIPRHAIINWTFLTASITWYAYASIAKENFLPPRFPLVFSLKELPTINSLVKITTLLQELDPIYEVRYDGKTS
ncbi:MAG: hypothetical protein KDD45_12745, partial [Bdellovibrionales bacterium]|nr:hypothetical protein [Bdellovibrionales bacterium]